jgi:predicted aldo/keto reductase-like oxidoreductase
MPTFEIEQYELHCMKYRVEADNEAAAIVKLLDGEAEAIDDGLEYVEVADDYGLSSEEYRELAGALREQGVPVDAVIPSIRSIEAI